MSRLKSLEKIPIIFKLLWTDNILKSSKNFFESVSLIDDVRIKTSKKLKNEIYKYYLKNTSEIYRINSKKFLEDFNILSVQRSLKIIGIFSRLFKRDKKKRYLKFIPYTWQLLDMRMNSEIFSDLKKILDDSVQKKFKKIVL